MSQDLPNELPAMARQDAGRRYVESAEAWLRKLAHFELVSRYGDNYISSGPWKKGLIDRVVKLLNAEAGAYTREIDATTFEQLIYVICHPDGWPMFRSALRLAYPDGVGEARTFLNRIKSIRNDVSHGRQCSSRQLEQAICYSNDIADSIKEHFRTENMYKEFNIPTFVSYADNAGNGGHVPPGGYYRVVNLSEVNHRRVYPGDVLIVEVDVDPSFEESCYRVEWWLKTMPGSRGDGKLSRLEITNGHVGERLELQFKLMAKNDWHRNSSGYDDVIDFYYKVLPPPT